MGKLAAPSVPFSLLTSRFSLQRPWRWALVLGLVVALAGCSRPTPGLPRVWAGQSVSPNVQAQSGTVVRLTIRATNDASNSGYGRASRVRSFTTYPDGVRVLDFTSSDVGRLVPVDMDRAWVQEIDTRHNVVVVSFGPIDAGRYKTATLTLLVQTPPGTTLVFRTLLLWQNDSPDQIPCVDLLCQEEIAAAGGDDPQVRAYVADNPAQVRALLQTYSGGGQGQANVVHLPVGAEARSTTAPQVDLLIDGERRGRTGAVFTSGEPVMLWYNLPDGSARYLNRTDALDDGRLDWTIDASDWDAIPREATSLVAHGQYSQVEALYLFKR